MNRNTSNALRLDANALGYQVGETVGRNSTPTLFHNVAKEMKAPPLGTCWCDRCRSIDGVTITHQPTCATLDEKKKPELGKPPTACDCRPSGPFAPAADMFMIHGTHAPRVLMVCLRCLGPDDVIMRRGGDEGVADNNREQLAEARVRKALLATLGPLPKLPRMSHKQLARLYDRSTIEAVAP